MNIKLVKQRIIPSGFYPDQIEAVNQISDFLNSDELEMTIAGAAGTGKTHLIRWVVNNLCKFAVCPTAPTHKALRVIEKHLNRKGKTLQALHGLRPNLDLANFNIASPQFDPRGMEHIKNYKLVIIDEASMITDDLFQLNHDRAKQYKVKILYIGDELQLPPIQSSKSNGKVFAIKNKYTLRQIVRQEVGNPLLELFPLLRNDVMKGTRTFLQHIFTNRENMTDTTGYTLLPFTKFNKDLFNYFELNKLKADLDYARVIAYTNEAVQRNNKFIRNKLLNNPKDILTPDDILTSYTTIVDEFNFPIIINSEDYYINTIRPYINSYDIKTYAVNLVSAYDSRLTQALQIVDHTDKSFLTYYKLLNHFHKNAITAHKTDRAARWKEYYNFKENMLTMITFNLSAENNNSVVKKDIDYGYAITAHKSQGSTFENVFLDLKDVLYYTTKHGNLVERFDKDMTNRLMYVALSRASNKVIMKL